MANHAQGCELRGNKMLKMQEIQSEELVEYLEIKASSPMEKICADIVKFPKTEDGSRYLLTAIGVYTHYVWAKPVNEIKSSTVIEFLEQIFCQFTDP